MIKGNLFKIKEGKVAKWRDWCRLLETTYKNEAIESLKEEGMSYEAFFIFTIGDDFYTIGIGEGKELPANMDRELNQKHRATKRECLEKVGELERDYELKI